MPITRQAIRLGSRGGPGWSSQEWASAGVFGAAVPMRADRYRLDPGAAGPEVPLAGQEAFGYVIAGTGTAQAAGEDFALAAESVLWLAGCSGLNVKGGPDGLDLLVAQSPPGPGAGSAPVPKVLAAADLPRLTSTRDTRDRLDLITEDVPVGAALMRADRISYHPGDTAAAHYHADCHHVFCVLAGSGLLHSGEYSGRLTAGDSALVGPGEEHWFENDTAENFSFVEFWAPPPRETIWTVTGDRCTWAPAG